MSVIVSRVFHTLNLDRIHLGRPARDAIVAEVDLRNADRVVVVTARSLEKSAVILSIADAIGSRLAGVYSGTVEHVPREAVFRLATYLKENRADLVVTVGGGTPIDTVKLALVCLAENITSGDQLDDFAVRVDSNGKRVTPRISTPPLRQIVVPTTLSGAEFSDLAGCVNVETKVKQLFSGSEIGSASVILDPAVTTQTPQTLWLSTGVRAIDHAVETICSAEPEPLADAGAIHALRILAKSLCANVIDPSDLGARLDSQTAVYLACAGLNRVPYGASHGIGHQIGAVAGVPHGYTSCVMLPHVMAFNVSETRAQQKWIADAMGRPDTGADQVVADLIAKLGMPARLRDVGVQRSDFEAIASGSILNAWVRGNIRPIKDAHTVMELLERAY